MAASQRLSAPLSTLKLCIRPNSFLRPSTTSQLFRASFNLTATPVRYASHADQGAANSGSKDGAGKRLGAKKIGGMI
jgi:hypothetical protein